MRFGYDDVRERPGVCSRGEAAARGDTGLLADKLAVPVLGLAVVARPRLAELMDQATAHRVTLRDRTGGIRQDSGVRELGSGARRRRRGGRSAG